MFGLTKKNKSLIIKKDRVVEVIEHHIRSRVNEEFDIIKHTKCQATKSNSDISRRQCLCSQTRFTESGLSYILVDLDNKKGRYYFYFSTLLFEEEKYKIWFGVCQECKTLYWECPKKEAQVLLVQQLDIPDTEKEEIALWRAWTLKNFVT